MEAKNIHQWLKTIWNQPYNILEQNSLSILVSKSIKRWEKKCLLANGALRIPKEQLMTLMRVFERLIKVGMVVGVD